MASSHRTPHRSRPQHPPFGRADHPGRFAAGLSGLRDLLWLNLCVGCQRHLADPTQPGASTASVAPASPTLRGTLCRDCAHDLHHPWERIFPAGVDLPLYAAGPYGGARRELILSAKRDKRPDAITLMGRMLNARLRTPADDGILAHPGAASTLLIPAPTRRSAARDRGGDVITRACRAAAAFLNADFPDSTHVLQAVEMADTAADSVGLSRQERRRNAAAGIRVRPGIARSLRRQAPAQVVLVDDVCTTGATMGMTTLALAGVGIRVSAGLVIARA